MFLSGHLDIVGCFFHGPDYGRVRLFFPHFTAAPPYQMGRYQ